MQVAERIVGDEGTEVVISVARPIGTNFTTSFTASFTTSFEDAAAAPSLPLVLLLALLLP